VTATYSDNSPYYSTADSVRSVRRGPSQLAEWNTAGRPSAPKPGTAGLNTDTGCVDVWDDLTSAWNSICNYSAPGSTCPTCDPYAGNVVLLLHMDGADGGNTFTDEKGHTFTAGGNCQTKTAHKVFGTASCHASAAGDTLTTSASADFKLNGQWTMEFWFLPVGNNFYFMSAYDNSTAQQWYFHYLATGRMEFLFLGATITGTTCPVALNDGNWHHIAVTRTADNYIHMFIDGLYVTSVAGGATTTFTNNMAPHITDLSTVPSVPLNGYVDEVRITNGVARYQAPFVVPPCPFVLTAC
jgi:hypothetical protein